MSRIYRALLRLYPSSFRTEFGDELASVFEANHRGTPAIVSAIDAVADVLPNAVAVHWDIVRQDLRYTWRALRRAPGFALTAVLVVALGVGANTAAFSVADFVLVRPLPFPSPDRLVKVWARTPGYSAMEMSPPNYADVRKVATSFSDMAAYYQTSANIVTGGEPQHVQGTATTATLFSVLGSHASIGRTFAPADTVAGDAIILSSDFWRTEFGGDPGILGKRIDLDGAPFTVIGVMPADFHFPDRSVSFWITNQLDPGSLGDRTNNMYDVVARLTRGASLEGANAELDVITAQLERSYPKENERTRAHARPLRDDLSQRARLLLLALCGAALCTLLLACSNLANLLLARAVGREREMAVRAALGAGRERLVRQLVTESIVLAAIGGLVGVGVAVLTVPALGRLVPDSLPFAHSPTVDVRVLAFAAALIVLTGLAFGVIPALRAGSSSSMFALREGARSGGGNKQRARTMLVMFEVTISVALLISSGLLVRAMWRLQAVDPGFVTDGILTVHTALPMPAYATVTRRARFYGQVLDGVRALPGVTGAAYITGAPMVMGWGIWAVGIQGHASIRDGANTASFRMITPQYFSTLGIPMMRGRDVSESDDTAHVAIAVVSESFAKRYWPNEDPIGKRFNFAFQDRTVAGVVGDIRVRGLERESEPQVYVPYRQVKDNMMMYYAPRDLIVRSSAEMATLVPAIRRIVRAADPIQPISNVATMQQIVTNQTASRLAQIRVLAALASIALLLAAVGLNGLLSYTVSNRVREIGVRVALGAEPQSILRMILREGVLLSLGGLLPGIALAYWAARGMQALLAGVTPADPATFAIATTVCVVTAIVGCVRPALRASSVDPATALRAE
jgi:predicted permease